MKKKKPDILGILAGLLMLFIVLPIIAVNLSMLIQLKRSPEQLPTFLGYSPVVIASGSMNPVFDNQALVFIRRVDPLTLKEGDIICYLDNGRTVVHRIRECVTKSGRICFVTKGDASIAADPSLVELSQVQGIYSGHIERAGQIVVFAQTPLGMVLLIGLPILLYLMLDLISRADERTRMARRTEELEQQLLRFKEIREEQWTQQEIDQEQIIAAEGIQQDPQQTVQQGEPPQP